MARIVKRRGTFIFDYYVGGKRIRLSFESRREAEDYKREYLLRVSGVYGSWPIAQISIADSIRKYVNSVTSTKGTEAPANEKLHFGRLYDFLLDEKKLFHLQDIRLMHLEELQAKLRAKVSASTVNRHFNCYKHFFNKCVRWELLDKSPASGLSRLPEDPKPRKLWTGEQMGNVIAELPDWAGDILFFIALTSARPGKEVGRICWGDIDFAQASVQVKSYKGTGEAKLRLLPLPPNLLEFLTQKKEVARRIFKAKDSDLVFVNSLGNPIESDVLDRLVRQACKKLGYEGLVPYGLRHTMLTELARGNVNLEKIRLLGGHSALNTTQKYLKLNLSQFSDDLQLTSAPKLVRVVTYGHKAENGPSPFVPKKNCK